MLKTERKNAPQNAKICWNLEKPYQPSSTGRDGESDAEGNDGNDGNSLPGLPAIRHRWDRETGGGGEPGVCEVGKLKSKDPQRLMAYLSFRHITRHIE